jgi:hypothetical protein
MSQISLLGSINTCKVNTGYANKIQSNRFEDPANMLCPLWPGSDSYGRAVNPDSFMTKTAGCNSAEDRVMTENFLRPQYMEYVALDANGFRNPTMFNTPQGSLPSNNPSSFSEGYQGRNVRENFDNSRTDPYRQKAIDTSNAALATYNIVGSAGYQYSNNNTQYSNGTCGVSGNPNCNGCSMRQPGRGANLYEGYEDRRAISNFKDRRDMSAVQGYMSRANSCMAGNNTY